MEGESLENIVEQALRYAEELGAKQAEIFGARGRIVLLMIEKKVPSATVSYIGGVAVRIATENNVGFAHTTSFSQESIRETVRLALESAKAKGKDKYFKSLPPEMPTEHVEPIYDKETAQASLDDILGVYETVKNIVDGSGKKIMLIGGGAVAGEGEVFLKNSLGVERRDKRTVVGCYFYALATDEIPPAMAFVYDERSRIRDMNLEKLGEKLIEETVKAKRAKEMVFTGKSSVIILPQALSSFLWVFSEEISAPNVDRGSTPFKREKIGEKIASEEISVLDNPRSEDNPWRTSRDDEGIPTKEIEIIRDGVLISHLTDYYYATKWNTEPTGSCRRISRWGFTWNPFVYPTVAPWWIEIRSKNQDSLENIINDVKEGFIIKDVMGIHQSDFASGKFSVPANGWYVKNGEIAFPVHNIMISGTIPELLANIKVISKEKERTEYGDLPAVMTEKTHVVASKSPLKYRIGLKIFNVLLRLGVIKNPIL